MVWFGSSLVPLKGWVPIFEEELEEMNRGKAGRLYEFSDTLIFYRLCS